MKLATLILLLLLVLLAAPPSAFALPPTRAAAAAPTASGVICKSKFLQMSMHQHLIGDCIVLIGPQQIAIRVLKSDLVFFTRKPYKTVTAYCRQTGKFYEADPAHFVNPFSKSRAFLSGVIYKDIPMVKTGQKQVLGLKADTYMASKAYSTDIRSRYLRKEISGSQPEKCLGSYLPYKADAPVLNLANAMLATPIVKDAVCLEMDMEELGAEKIKYVSISKASTINASEALLKQFEMPRGLKLVKNIEEVIQNESAGDAIKMMMDSGGSVPFK